jgi:hypothetical protein
VGHRHTFEGPAGIVFGQIVARIHEKSLLIKNFLNPTALDKSCRPELSSGGLFNPQTRFVGWNSIRAGRQSDNLFSILFLDLNNFALVMKIYKI